VSGSSKPGPGPRKPGPNKASPKPKSNEKLSETERNIPKNSDEKVEKVKAKIRDSQDPKFCLALMQPQTSPKAGTWKKEGQVE